MANVAEPRKTNKRRAFRSKPRSYVRLECRKGAMGLGANIGTVLMDISETGARLVVKQELKPAQEVEVIFNGYGMSQAVKRLASVRWQLKLEDGSYCVGIEFQKRVDYRDMQSIASPN